MNSTGLLSSGIHGGGVDLAMVEEQASFLQKTGVKYAYVSGTTGDSVLLTFDERTRLAQAWATIGPKFGISVIVHVGADSVEEARALAAFTETLKPRVWGIAAMPPTFFRPANIEALVETMSFIAAGAPSLPFLYYHIPSKTNVLLPMIDFLKASKGRFPTLFGIKYTHYDLMDFSFCVNEQDKKFNMLYGRDQWLLSALVLGADGAVGTTYNFIGELQNANIAAYNKGDLDGARANQLAVSTLTDSLVKMEEDCNCDSMRVFNNLVAAPSGPARLPFLGSSEKLVSQAKSIKDEFCATTPVKKPVWC